MKNKTNEMCSHVDETSIGDICTLTCIPCFSQEKCITLDKLLEIADVNIVKKTK